MIPTDPAKRLAPGLAARSPVGDLPTPAAPFFLAGRADAGAVLQKGGAAGLSPQRRLRITAPRCSAAYHLIFTDAMTIPTL